MASGLEQAGEAAITKVLTEAADEITGESKGRWALVLVVALVLLGVGVVMAIRWRNRHTAARVASTDANPTP